MLDDVCSSLRCCMIMWPNVGQIRMILQFCPKSLLPHSLGHKWGQKIFKTNPFSAQMWELSVGCSLENVSSKHLKLSLVSHSQHGLSIEVSVIGQIIICKPQIRFCKVVAHEFCSICFTWLSFTDCVLRVKSFGRNWLTISDIKILHLSHNYPG